MSIQDWNQLVWTITESRGKLGLLAGDELVFGSAGTGILIKNRAPLVWGTDCQYLSLLQATVSYEGTTFLLTRQQETLTCVAKDAITSARAGDSDPHPSGGEDPGAGSWTAQEGGARNDDDELPGGSHSSAERVSQ
ncbi:MAG TPA: hypothetical protein VN851_09000 [Thermoanaerobaculia bacterium]|nr:hypothetical protein [Thermoanaerobaculia bacterium]